MVDTTQKYIAYAALGALNIFRNAKPIIAIVDE